MNKTDLAEERRGTNEIRIDGIEYKKKSYDSFTLSYLDIKSPLGEQLIEKPIGSYITLSHPALCDLGEKEFMIASRLAAAEIRQAAEAKYNSSIKNGISVLAVGIGNAQVAFDSLGCETVDRIDGSRSEKHKIFRFIPRSAAQNGIETQKLVLGAVKAAKPDIIVAIDSILARSVERLGRTIQISDSGICPGSGVGSEHEAISLETMGVPVISLGIPTVSDAGTVLGGILDEVSLNINSAIMKGLEKFLVIPANFELMRHTLPCLAASAIELAFSDLELPDVIYKDVYEYN